MKRAEKYYYNPLEYVSESRFSYNGIGRVTDANEVVLDNQAHFIRYSYDQAGNLTGVSYPSTSASEPNTIEIVHLIKIGGFSVPSYPIIYGLGITLAGAGIKAGAA